MKQQFSLKDLDDFISLCKKNCIEFYLDGGWGVDALLGIQTREHEDLDIGVLRQDATKLRSLLEGKGYEELVRHDSSDWNYVLVDSQGHKVDVHTYELDHEGHHVWGIEHSIESLTGKGMINGREVDCISPQWMIKFHSGYKLDENDYHDVKALCDKFYIPLPREYAKFEKNETNKD